MIEVREFVDKMRATSSSNDKIAIITQSTAFIHEVLEATYNPYKQYYVTSKTCKKNGEKVAAGPVTPLFKLLDMLSSRKVTGHDAIRLVNRFAQANVGWDIIYDIIDKDLKIRTGAKVINKAFPNLIPEFNVALAQEYKGKCKWEDEWYVSRKLDGVRCIARVDDEGNCSLFSRTGKEFTTLNAVKKAIEDTNIVSTTFDGEICLVDKHGKEDFQGIMKQLRRKDHQIENPAFIMFDMMSNTDFDNGKGTEPLKTRLHKLLTYINRIYRSDRRYILRYNDQFIISGDDHFEYWNELSAERCWEGVMLRKNVGYEGKRTKNLVKVKEFHDAEYEVVGWDIDTHEVVRDGKSESMTMLAQVWINHKGNVVKVGSGFTQEQRLQYMDGSILGKIITVQYFEETKNDRGGISLRFPTVKVIHGDKREM
jgi:DNA ligase 1